MKKQKIAVLTSGWSVDYVLSVLEGMKRACVNQNIDLYVFTCYLFTEPSGEKNSTSFVIFNLINFKDFDGIVIMPDLFNDPQQSEIQRQRILESGVPAVSLKLPMEGLSLVNSQNHDENKELIKHLITDHKVTKFGFSGGPEGDADSEANYNSLIGAIKESGLTIENQIIRTYSDWTFNSAYESSAVFFADKSKIPQAIICANDWAAMATIKRAEENGISVPDDLIVVGMDDIALSSKVIPSISTVNVSADQMGEEAIKLVLSKPSTPKTVTVKAEVHLRQSCGCIRKITTEQKIYSQNFSKLIDAEQRFSSHLRHLEDAFIKNQNTMELSNSLQNYYEKRNAFEGPDFSILINQNVISSLNETKKSLKKSLDFDTKLQALVNLENGKRVHRYQIEKFQLVPPNMLDDKSNLFLFLPIFNQKFVLGYYIAKNCTNLIENKNGYNWTRNLGAILEKYRQTNDYRILSEKMTFLSNQDALSGLYNRTGFENYGFKLYNSNIAGGKRTEIIFIDINNMKVINDKFGHLQGDLAVKTVAKAINESIPDNYLAIRYGGDEFVVIGTNENDSTEYCKKIDEKLAAQVTRMTLPYNLSVSSGSKIFTAENQLTIQEAIEEVDEIMYRKKVQFHETH